jgi:RND superfamily putative drug exporter
VKALQRAIVGRASALISVLVLGLGGFLIVGLGQATHEPAVDDSLPAGYDSTRAAQLREQLPDEDSSIAVVLFTGIEQGQVGELDALVRDLGVDRVTVPSKGAAVIPSEDGKAALSILSVEATGATAIADGVKELRAQLDERAPDGVKAQVTGPAAIQADLAAVFDGADFRLLAATASVVAILLVITYRSPILWVIPLLVVGIADQTASVLATQALAGLGVAWDESTTGILSVLVFGAGTDYALLLISRYRRPGQRDHRRARRALPVPVADPDHTRARHRLRGGDRGRGGLRPRGTARNPGAVRPLGVLAQGPAAGFGVPGRGPLAVASGG